MKKRTIEEIQNLHKMTVRELRAKYASVFGEESRSNNKDYLRKKIAWRLQSLDEGGLSERAKKRAEELANDADIRTRAPKTKPKKESADPAEVAIFKSKLIPPELLPGMTLKRVYKNQTLIVTVTDSRFLYNGKIYRSLTAIAKEVTGSMWNGRLFFGLTKHKRGTHAKKEK